MLRKVNKKDFAIIFGGSFNPFHRGHLHILSLLLEKFPENLIEIIPSFLPPFKENKKILPFSLRVKLIELSLIDFSKEEKNFNLSRLHINTIERDLKGVSFTSELIREIVKRQDISMQELYKEKIKLSFACGDDILENLDNWHDVDFIKKSLRFIVFSRSLEDNKVQMLLDLRKKQSFDILYIKCDKYLASSSSFNESLDFSLLTETAARQLRNFLGR